jgi:uncharacterized protein (DUF1786 family)
LILAIDVGKGTEDVLLYQHGESFENSIQMVAPSAAQILAMQIKNDPSKRIVIDGELMAGEPWHKEIYQRCANAPNSVVMSETSARSLRYNLDQVRSRGVQVVPNNEIHDFKGSKYVISDIIWDRIIGLIEASGINHEMIQTVLLCCQDHGEPSDPAQSVRDFRMKSIYQPIQKTGKLEDLLINASDVPSILPRHQAICRSALKHIPHLTPRSVYIMDSSPAVALGVKSDESDQLIVNVGNGHTLAVIVENKLVQAIYEMHTGGITSEKVLGDLKLLLSNQLTHEDALKSGGHGIFSRKVFNSSIEDFLPITLIGPNRSKLTGLPVQLEHPGGNMMMAGPIGLIKAYESIK